MKLRCLELKDAVGMLEWMHDPQIMQHFRFSGSGNTLESTENFIRIAQEQYKLKNHMHYAIADNNDNYMGTVSLKNIDHNAKNAEYAICLRSCAHGKGIGKFATREVLRIAFEELKLNRVYLNVLSNNIAAIRMYKKIGFIYEGEFRQHLCINENLHSLQWFAMLSEEYHTLNFPEEKARSGIK